MRGEIGKMEELIEMVKEARDEIMEARKERMRKQIEKE